MKQQMECHEFPLYSQAGGNAAFGGISSRNDEASACEKDSSNPDQDRPSRPYNENAMNIVLVGAECAPWSKTGGAILPDQGFHLVHREMSHCSIEILKQYIQEWLGMHQAA